MIRPYRATPSARPTKIRDLPNTLSFSEMAPRAAEAEEATARPPPMPDRPTARAAPRYFRPVARPSEAAAAAAPVSAAEAAPPKPHTAVTINRPQNMAILPSRA